ncbi:MAG: NAD(P)/FAD-dependent oxidoreductase [Bacteroidales bacterium]|nr:NAD(P)/FAD-dependent oxidoreductase [Bacteroidales bacterium]MCF8454711.1 NAD(P)/FAD-dependent oxidoreductase [Bacteroidales bacterium]
MKKIAIIGGGIMGMTVALRLAEKGYAVNLYEASESLGGLTSVWQIDDITWDKFYHVVLLSDTFTRKIIGETGLEDQARWVETKSGFYSGGKLHSMSNLIEFFKFPPINLIDKFRLGLTIFVASKIKDWKRLEKIPVENWLRKWSGKNTFNKIWLPLLKSKLGDNYKETSASFIWATIQRMYAARRTGLKKEMFGYVEGGYASILEKFQELLIKKGVKIHIFHPIEKIRRAGKEVEVQFKNGKTETFPKVIATIPSSLFAGLTEGLQEVEYNKLNEVQYVGVVCTSLLLRKQISPYYVTNITDEDNPFTGIIEMGALVDKKSFKGHSLIYLPKYVKAIDPFFQKTNEEVENIFLDALFRMYPHLSSDDVVAIKTTRAANVFALPTLGYSKKLTDMKTTIEGLYIINSSYITNSTLNVNDTVQLAEKAIARYF